MYFNEGAEQGNYCSIVFGEPKFKEKNEDKLKLDYIRTKSPETWEVEMSAVAVAGEPAGYTFPRGAIFEPSLPYIYLPYSAGYHEASLALLRSYGVEEGAYAYPCARAGCYFRRRCEDITPRDISITIKDENNSITLTADSASLLIPGDLIPVQKRAGEPLRYSAEECFLPIFPSGEEDGPWYLGSMMLTNRFTVFDMKNLASNKGSYLQIGFGNKADLAIV